MQVSLLRGQTMLQYQPFLDLTEDDLPYSDNQPVDNELQTLLPSLLRAILALLWAEREDWCLGINMGIYADPPQAAIGPDAFLSLGVTRYKQERGRLSYVVPQEKGIMPQWVLEIVSQKPGGEYDEKFNKYAELGVLYYVVYNPNHWKRDRHEPFEVYRLEQGQYERQQGNPVWMPEIGLGIGTARGKHEGLSREWLYWYDEAGQQYLAPENVIEQERELREQERELREQAEQQYQREQTLRAQAEQAQQAAENQARQEQALRAQAEQMAKTLVIQQLTQRLGELPEAMLSQIDRLAMTQLAALGAAVLDFSSLNELAAWLEQQ
jgi:Uma2 family endonuclease